MKHTKLAGFVVGFVFLFTVFINESEALVPLPRTLVTIVPSPTPLIIKKIVDPNIFKVILTSTPVPTIVSVVSPTTLPTDKLLSSTTPKPTVSETATATPTLTETPTSEAIVSVAELRQTVNDSAKSQDNLTFWFLIVTVGLLAVIIVIQAWPKKNDE